MDPGLGLIVNSILPNEVEVPKPLPKPPLQLPDGFLEKSHVRHALKYMPDDEQREKVLEVALAWEKKFATKNWRAVVATIEAISKEDNVRSGPHDHRLHELYTTANSPERPQAVTVESTLIIPQTASQSMPMHARHTHLHTTTASLPFRRPPAPCTPRTYRWDVMPTGPVTPLSPTPMGNAFFGGGFWENSISHAEYHKTSAHITVVDHKPVSPIIPIDTDARAVYEKVKNDVDALARRYCLARYKMRASLSDNGFVPASMIKPRDMMEASRVALQHRKVKLKSVIIEDLPSKLQSHAVDEGALRRQLGIKDEVDLAEQNDWMNDEVFTAVPEGLTSEDYKAPIHLAVSILDEQREAFRNLCTHGKYVDLELTDNAIEAAWGVRIMEDAERLVAFEADGSSSGGDDDDGYSYGNFLRSIKSEMGTSLSSGTLASMVEELSNSDLTSLRSRANTHQTFSSTRSRESRGPQRSTGKFIRETHLPTCSSEFSILSNTYQHNNSLHRCIDLRISTETIDDVPSGELSPEDREFRHRGPNMADLNNWAQELKKMEVMRADRERSPTLHRHPLMRSTGLNNSTHKRSTAMRMSVDSVNTRILPTRALHSQFSSSSSSLSSVSSNLLEPLSVPSISHHPPSSSSSAPKNTPIDHQHHQNNISKSLRSKHYCDTSKASTYDSLQRNKHLPSASSVNIIAKGVAREEEDDWISELRCMESRERIRQEHERRRTSQLLEGDEPSLCAARDCGSQME